MANTTTISVQIDKKDKEQVSEILQKLGISLSGLINMTIKQVIMKSGIPFNISIPKNELENYFTDDELNKISKELMYIKEHSDEYKKFDSVKDLMEDLNSDD